MKIYDIYSVEIPLCVTELVDTSDIKRLSDIGQCCGVEYTKFPEFCLKGKYTRLEHSIGVALILWNFTKDVKQTVAGLLHDISSPCFAHVIDFLKNDYVKQETTEERTFEIINNSKEIQRILKNYGLKSEDVADYHIYPLADNKTPMLSADRLEYTLGNAYYRGIKSKNELSFLYNNLKIVKNESGIEELAFSDINTALCFTEISLSNSRWYVSDNDRFSMQYLADIIKIAYNKNLINESDLYTTESNIISKFRQDDEILALWNKYISLDCIEIFNMKKEDRYCVNIPAKKRYINPLVVNEDECLRISALSCEIAESIDNFLNLNFDKWMCLKSI